jgi:CBS domain-containing protein
VRTVQDILAKKGSDVAAVPRDANVLEAAKIMNERRIGALVVTSGDQVIGIFTERDIMNRVVAGGRSPESVNVGEVMTSPCACCRPDTTLEECRGVMTEKKIRHLPVVDAGRLTGMVSIGDLMAAEAVNRQITIEYLHEYLYGRT